MKIQKVKIKNFKCISDAEVNLNGHNVYLIAPNAAGKTSFIDAAFGSMPKKPLKDGERNGRVEIQIDEYLCQFTFNNKKAGTKFEIFDNTGQPQKEPKTLFKKLFGVKDFEIDKFLSLSASKQVEQIKEIIGIDWTDVDARFKELYNERTFLNRQVKEIDAKIEGRIWDSELKKIDTSELQAGIQKAAEHNATVRRIAQGVKDKKEQISALELELEKLKTDVQNGESWLITNKEENIDDLNKKLSEAIENNEKVEANAENGRLRDESGTLWGKIEHIEEEMNSIKELKAKELEAAEMPVEGLTFDGEELFLDGQPFNSDQINTARRIVAGLEMQFHLMSDVKIARFDGSLLDKNSLNHVKKWAEEKGVQLFVEMVDRDGDKLKIEVEEES